MINILAKFIFGRKGLSGILTIASDIVKTSGIKWANSVSLIILDIASLLGSDAVIAINNPETRKALRSLINRIMDMILPYEDK